MSGQSTAQPPILRSSEAILAVADVLESVKFYRDVLGFTGQWLWGEPPTFAGVSFGPVQVMMCKQPELAAKVAGHMHFFRCEDIEALYAMHCQRNAPIIEKIENKPWGIREYAVRDPSGYHLRFAGPIIYERPPSAKDVMPSYVKLEQRLPSHEEFCAMTDSVGWNRNTGSMQIALKQSLFGVVAIDTRPESNGKIVGMLRVVGDSGRFFYIQDVMVVPELQHQKIGTALMESVMAWLRQNAPKGAFVALFTGKHAFYEKFGFKRGDGGMNMVF